MQVRLCIVILSDWDLLDFKNLLKKYTLFLFKFIKNFASQVALGGSKFAYLCGHITRKFLNNCATRGPLNVGAHRLKQVYTIDSAVIKMSEGREAVEARYLELYPRGTPLIVACENGNLDDVEVLLTINNKNVVGTNSYGYEYTPLMAAANFEHFQVVEYLIGEGADANIVNSDGENALHCAAISNRRSTEVIELLLNHMDLDSINKKEDRYGDTPLDKAYGNGPNRPLRQEIIALIRSAGGKANYYDANGEFVGKGNGDLNVANHAVLGTYYTLEEFKRIEFPKESLELKIPDGIEAAGCDFINEESPTLKMPVKVKVNDGNDFRWDVAGDKLFVFCAVELKKHLKDYDFNPYNRRVIVGVQYLTEKEIKAEELKYTKKRQLEEPAEVSPNKRQSKFLDSLKF